VKRPALPLQTGTVTQTPSLRLEPSERRTVNGER
jgi:hypothetical protein